MNNQVIVEAEKAYFISLGGDGRSVGERYCNYARCSDCKLNECNNGFNKHCGELTFVEVAKILNVKLDNTGKLYK